MLAQYQVDRVRRLLAREKLSYRRIARRTGVSRGAIAEIAAGRQPDPPPKKREVVYDDDFEKPLVPPRRCPTCGGFVYPPCRLCRTRAFLRTHLEIVACRLPIEYPLIVGLDLKPRHRTRYEIVRRRRRKMEAAAG